MLPTLGRAVFRRVAASPHSRVVLQLQRVARSQSSQQLSVSRPLRLLLSSRSYATATTTATKTKKKPATKKPASKKPATKKAAPKKKPVKKVVKKVKVKAPPSPETLARKERQQKYDIYKKYLAKSLVAEQPNAKIRRSAYSQFMTEQLSGNIGGAPQREKLAAAASRWKSMDAAEQQRYQTRSDEVRAEAQIALQKWIESHTPLEIREANIARAVLRRLLQKKYEEKNSIRRSSDRFVELHDPRQPTAPLAPQLIFARQRWKEGDFVGMLVSQVTPQISKEWTGMSDSEKEPYREASRKDRERYKQEFQTVFGTEYGVKLKL